MLTSKNTIRAIFFDLGYTLIYFNGDFSKAVAESYRILADKLIRAGGTFNKVEFVKRFDEVMQIYYRQREIDLQEHPIEVYVHKVLAEFHQDHLPADVCREAMNEMYRDTERFWQIEEDTHDTLKSLADMNFRLALISNASDAWDVNNLIDDHGLRSYFQVVLISASEGIRKPDPRIFKKAASLMQVDLSESVMVGDTLDADVLGANNCGMKTVWITRRSEKQESLSAAQLKIKPDAEIRSLRELPALLNSWNQ